MPIPNCLPGQPNTTENPCVPVPHSLNDLVSSLDFTSVISAVLTIMAALAAVFIVMRGGDLILNKINSTPVDHDYNDKQLNHGLDYEGEYRRSTSYDDVIDGVDYDRVD